MWRPTACNPYGVQTVAACVASRRRNGAWRTRICREVRSTVLGYIQRGGQMHRAGVVADKRPATLQRRHEVQQRISRSDPARDLTGGDAVNQYRLGNTVVFLVEGAFVLAAQVNQAIFDHHCADRQNTVAVDVQPAGLQIHHHKATIIQRGIIYDDTSMKPPLLTSSVII